MAKSYQDLITQAREILQDKDGDPAFRDADVVLIEKLNMGLQELNRLRPDAFYHTFVDTDTVVPEVTADNLSLSFSPPMLFYTALIYYVVGSVELKDDEFATDNRAITLLNSFRNMVVGL